VIVFIFIIIIVIFFWVKYINRDVALITFTVPSSNQLLPTILWSFEKARIKGEQRKNCKLFQLKPESKSYATVKDLIYKHLGGGRVIIKDIFAVYNMNLLHAFLIYETNLEERFTQAPQLYKHQKWQQQDPDGLKQWIQDVFSIYTSSFTWNNDRIIKIIPQIHGTEFETAIAICETGFTTLALLDNGWYGKGIYFTSNVEYAIPYFGPKKVPTFIIAYVIPGNPYPVSEHPMEDNSLAGTALQSGAQSHYVVTSIKGFPVTKPCSSHFDELVITQEAQVVPAFIVTVDPTNLLELFTIFKRDIIEK